MAGRLRLAAGALLMLLAFAQLGPVSAASTQGELARARKELTALRRELRPLRAQANALHAEIVSITTRLVQAQAQVEALEFARQEAQKALDLSREEAARLQENLDARARDAYIRGPAGALELILEADSLANLANRVGFLEVLNEADANVADGLRVERQRIAEFRAQLTSYLKEKERLLTQLQRQRVVLEARFQELETAREAVADKVEEAQDVVSKLEAQQARSYLQQYGITVGPPLGADGPFYRCPVAGPLSYVDSWGAPRSGGRSHQGTDMFSLMGVEIVAPFDGTAEEHLDGLGGFTVNVYASANADYVYNAHMSRFAGVDGQKVKAGDVIGYVGESGNAAGTSPHDHIQYSPGGGSPVNPYPYLNEVCGVNGAGF